MLTPTLFLPGLLCDVDLWREPVGLLADMVAPAVADLTLDDTVGAMAARTLAAAPPRFALVALSMGGYVAFEMLRQAPERIERLALLDTSAAADTPARAAQRRGAIESLARGHFLGVTDRLLPQLVHHDRLSGPVADRVKAMAARVGGDAFIRQQRAILSRPDSRLLLPAIMVPTLVAAGREDVLTPLADAEEIARGVPGAALHVLEDCGHLPAIEQPEATARLLRAWLADQPASR